MAYLQNKTPEAISEWNRKVRLNGYRNIRQALGLPEPTEREQKQKREINERYRAKQRAAAEEAARKKAERAERRKAAAAAKRK